MKGAPLALTGKSAGAASLNWVWYRLAPRLQAGGGGWGGWGAWGGKGRCLE